MRHVTQPAGSCFEDARFPTQIMLGRDFKALLSLSSPHPVPANTGRCRHGRRWGSKSSLGKGRGGVLNPGLCT